MPHCFIRLCSDTFNA